MRHRNAGRTLGRNASHRRALFRNLTRALFEHGRIITTVAKAKEVRPWVEHLITLAKRGLADPAKARAHRTGCAWNGCTTKIRSRSYSPRSRRATRIGPAAIPASSNGTNAG